MNMQMLLLNSTVYKIVSYIEISGFCYLFILQQFLSVIYILKPVYLVLCYNFLIPSPPLFLNVNRSA